MKKIIKTLGLLLLSSCLFFACDGLTGGNENGNTDDDGEKVNAVNLTFSLGDAKAIGIVNNGSSSAERAASDNFISDSISGNLVKILEDGTTESVITVPKGVVLPPVTAVWPGKKAGSKAFYLLFESDPSQEYTVTIEKAVDTDDDGVNDSFEYETETHSYELGQFLYIKDDGTYDDILKSSDGTFRYICTYDYEDMIKFDKYGYMYYMANESTESLSTAIIYRYSPDLSKSLAMTVAAPDMTYSSFEISSDAAWVFVMGNSPAAPNGFFRAIPVSAPTNPINLTYNYVPTGYFYDSVTESLFLTLDENYSSTDSSLVSGLHSLKLDENNLFDLANVQKITRSIPLDMLTKVTEKCIPAENLNVDLFIYEYDEDSSSWKATRKSATLMTDYILDYDVYVDYLITQLNSYYYKENIKGKSGLTESDWTPLTIDDVDFRFDNFANIEGFELFASELKGKKNQEAFKKIYETPKLKKLYGSLCASDRYYRAPNTTEYKNNFLADICYKKDSTELFFDSNKKYFRNVDTFNSSESIRFLFYEGDYYDWADEFYTASADLDTDKILNHIFGLCNRSGEKEFKLSAFENLTGYEDLASDKTGKDAILWITESQNRMKVMYNCCGDEDLLHNNKFLQTACFLAGTEESAVKFRENYYVRYDETKINRFFRTTKGLFGISENHIIHIMNEEGFVIMQVPDVLSTYSTNWLTEGGTGFIFRHDLLDATKHPTGYHNLYYYNVEEDSVADLFKQLPNKNSFEVYSFSVSGNTVMYSGVQGGGYVTCTVDIVSLQNEIKDIAYKLSDITIL